MTTPILLDLVRASSWPAGEAGLTVRPASVREIREVQPVTLNAKDRSYALAAEGRAAARRVVDGCLLAQRD